MVIERKHTADLIPADYNPRKDLKPGDAEYEKLKRSIEQFGYVEPVIWNKTTGFVVGGHQRLKVLLDMGITEVECVVVEMDAEKEKALNIALNKISGEWDKDKLRRLTPTECARLQGFPDFWCADLDTPEPTEEDIAFWTEVWETRRRVVGGSTKAKSRNQIIKWLQHPHSDAAEYKMWGNGVALPNVFFVLAGIVWSTQLSSQ